MLLFMLHSCDQTVQTRSGWWQDGDKGNNQKLLFGSSKGYFNAEWISQNLKFGLVQHKVR